jgi:hypothetical protein
MYKKHCVFVYLYLTEELPARFVTAMVLLLMRDVHRDAQYSMRISAEVS